MPPRDAARIDAAASAVAASFISTFGATWTSGEDLGRQTEATLPTR